VDENETVYSQWVPCTGSKIPAKFWLIEVQTGSYLGKDDIIRIEDDYRRP
jgi:mannose-6-phosphate isomerase-like protein (cupin superfamily)